MRPRRIVRDEAALGELHIAHKSNANWRLEACILCPSLALQASTRGVFGKIALTKAFPLASLSPMDNNKTRNKSIPYLSLCGAIGFAVSVIALTILEMMYTPEPSKEAQQAHVLHVMICVLLASWSSIVSLITAWCPVILGGDRRPLYWVVPLVLGWIVFVQLFDWTSLVPHGPKAGVPEAQSLRLELNSPASKHVRHPRGRSGEDRRRHSDRLIVRLKLTHGLELSR
jgi:hypothetical protein